MCSIPACICGFVAGDSRPVECGGGIFARYIHILPINLRRNDRIADFAHQQIAIAELKLQTGCTAFIESILNAIRRITLYNHLLQPASGFPFVLTFSIIQRIANRIVSNCLPIVCRQLVLPVGIRILIRNILNDFAQFAFSIRILHLAENISAAVVIIDPRRILIWIVYSNQLSQCVISVSRGQFAALFGDDVAAIVVSVFEIHSVLGDFLHQIRACARAVMIFIAREVFILRFHRSDLAARQPAEGIIGVFERFAVEFNALRAAVRVVCERRFMRAVRRLFTEGLQAAAAIVFQRRAVNQRVRLRVAQRRLARAIGLVVVRARNSAKVSVLDLCGCAIVVSLIYH